MKKLNKIYKEILNEDLTYSSASTTGEEDDEYEIGKIVEISIPNLRIHKDIKISDEEKSKIKGLNASNLIISQGEFDGTIANMNVALPWDSAVNDGGIITDIQILKSGLYQIHISISDDIRGLGVGYKTYVALIHDLGHLYSGKGRMQNTSEVPRIWDKLNNESDITVHNNELGNIAILNNNPNKDMLLKKVGL